MKFILRSHLRQQRQVYHQNQDMPPDLVPFFCKIIPCLSHHVLGVYVAQGSEISLNSIISYAQPLCPVVFPHVEGKDMAFYTSHYTSQGKRLSPTVVLVPLLGFDQYGHRLGQGGGFYDRFLNAASPSPVTIGVAYDCQEVEGIPVEPHDYPLEWMITPTRVIQTMRAS